MGLGREEHGGDGEPLVLLHGVATSRLIWRHVTGPLAPAAAASSRSTCPASASPRRPAPASSSSESPTRSSTGSAIERFDLVGPLPRRRGRGRRRRPPPGGACAGSILVSPAGLAPRAHGRSPPRSAPPPSSPSTPAAPSATRGWSAPPPAGRCSARPSPTPAGCDPDDARMLLEASDGARRIADGVRQALEADLRDDLAAAPMPVGLIWGAADRVVPFGGLDALRQLRPDMRRWRRSPAPGTSRRSRIPRRSSPRSSGSSRRCSRRRGRWPLMRRA